MPLYVLSNDLLFLTLQIILKYILLALWLTLVDHSSWLTFASWSWPWHWLDTVSLGLQWNSNMLQMVQKTQQWRWSHQMYIMKQDQTSICPAQLSPVLLPSFSGLWMEHCCPIRDQNSVWRTLRPVRVVATAAGPIIPEPWGTRHLSPLTSLCWVSGREEMETVMGGERVVLKVSQILRGHSWTGMLGLWSMYRKVSLNSFHRINIWCYLQYFPKPSNHRG